MQKCQGMHVTELDSVHHTPEYTLTLQMACSTWRQARSSRLSGSFLCGSGAMTPLFGRKGWMVAYDTRLATFERVNLDATTNHRLWLPTVGASIQCIKLVNAIHNLYVTGHIFLSREDA